MNTEGKRKGLFFYFVTAKQLFCPGSLHSKMKLLFIPLSTIQILTFYFQVDVRHSEPLWVSNCEQACICTGDLIQKNQGPLHRETVLKTQLSSGLVGKDICKFLYP